MKARSVGSNAAALAISLGDYTSAVSLLEQSRSAIFAGLGLYRSTNEDLQKASPTLARRFVEMCAALDALVIGTSSLGEACTSGFQDKATRWVPAV